MEDQQQLIIKMNLDAWHLHIARADKLFSSLSDEQLQEKVAPGRNSGIYLLGHLTAIHDAMFPLMALGKKLYPELEENFINNPDKTSVEKPVPGKLKNCWSEVNNKLSQNFKQLTFSDWFKKHTSISDEDFEKEPYRNRLNVLINRTNHLAYHLGQLAFLKK